MRDYDKKTLAMMSPTIIALSILFVVPLILSVKMSMFSTDGTFIGLDAYGKILENPMAIDSLFFTLAFSAVSTIIAIVIAIAIALVLRKTFVGKRISTFLFQLNIPVPYIAFTLMIILLLKKTGFVSRILYSLGVISSASDFPLLVFDKYGIGIVLSYVLKFIPFMGVAILAVLQSSVSEHEDQATTLGANKLQTFRYVTLPKIMPAVAMTAMISFAYAFGSYEVPSLIGTVNPVALPKLAYNYYISYDITERPVAYALSVVMMLIITAIVSVYLYFTMRGRDNE